MNIRNLFSKFRLKLRGKIKGYVVLLLVVFVPLIMLGTKLALDLMTMHDLMINTRTSGPAYRKCAGKAALAVAENWNPGKSLDHQRRAVLKIADKVYNDNPPHDASNELSKAVPGIQIMTKDQVVIGKGFDPIIVTTKNIPIEVGQIPYSSASKYLVKRQILQKNYLADLNWNLPFIAWKLIDKLTSETTSYDKFDELNQNEYQSGKYVLNHTDRYIYPHQRYVRSSANYPTRDAFLTYTVQGQDTDIILVSDTAENTNDSGYTEQFGKGVTETEATCKIYNSQNNGTYTYRENENDNRVKISVENDKIKVQTDYDIGYATPAECNVDIVLACPTNGAACNKNNRDQNSTTPEMPYLDAESGDILGTRTEPPADAKSCPIYQIGQALRAFAKEFYHTKGVTMGLIPYSGKVSLDPDVANGYTMTYNTYNYNSGYFCASYYTSNQNTYKAYLRGTTLYDSYGMTNAELNNGYSWNSLLTACPIRCRGRSDCITGDHTKTGNNCVCLPDILSNAAPGDRTKFFRQNSNPCYGGYANLLTMRCERNCMVYLPNPYYIIEPTADVQKIYEICGALYPFYDEYNVSNFLFIPITWANNLWQDWTRNPEHAAVDTDASGNGGQLEIPSKMKEGRKKVLILVVNKPDWFEPHELTYLGFDNDCSELCMIESDRIDFSQNYGDTSKKFADGSSYDGTIQGPKKILKFQTMSGAITRNSDTGYYECDSATATLFFPKKYLVKVVVEPLQRFYWTYKGNFLHLGTDKTQWNQLTYNGSSWMAVNDEGYTAVSTDAVSWSNKNRIATANQRGIAYGNGTYVSASAGSWGCYVSHDDGNSWTLHKLFGYDGTCDVAFGNGWWFVSNYWAARSFSKDNGENWDSKQDVGKYFGARKNFFLAYLNGTWMALSEPGEVQTTTDLNGENWTWLGNKLGNKSSKWKRLCGANGRFVALSEEGISAMSKDNGQTWEYSTIGNGSNWTGISYGQDKFVACGSDGDIAFLDIKLEGSIQFLNVSSSTYGTTGDECTINEKREFYIEPSQMNGNSIDISLKNMRLISAEITNRPYKRVKAECTLDGTNIKTNCKKAMTLKVAPGATGKITFYNDNKIEDNVGTHTITTPTTFNFSGAQLTNRSSWQDNTLSSMGKNFAHNLSKYKVRYSATNSSIISASLNKQVIRNYAGNYNRHGWSGGSSKHLILNTGQLAEYFVSSRGVYLPINSWSSVLTHPEFFYCADSCLTLDSGYMCWSNGEGYQYGDLEAYGSFRIYGLQPPFYFWNYGGVGAQVTHNSNSLECHSYQSSMYFDNAAWNPDSITIDISTSEMNQFYVESTNTKTLLNTTIDTTGSQNTNIEQNKGIALQRLSSNLSNQIVAGDYICFQGDGDLSVTVEPTNNGQSSMTYTNTSDTSITKIYSGGPQTITIDPNNYKYENDGQGGYIIRLTTNNVTLSDLQLVDTSDVFEWDKIRMPEMSRWIDTSKNPYELNLCETTDLTTYWTYSDGFYVNKGTNGWGVLIKFSDIPGDYSSFSYSDNPYTMIHMCTDGWIDYGPSNRRVKEYPVSGLSRAYTLFALTPQQNKNSGWSCNDLNNGKTDTISLIMQSMTLPVNTALYYAYHDSAIHKAEWYTNSKGEYEYDASEASKNVTKAACTKLKNDFGNNLRIYLIKYRKQTQYKHKITGNPTNYDYSYLDDCADKIYDIDETTYPNDSVDTVVGVKAQAALTNTLKAVAADVKSWAGHTPAKNVE